VIDAQVEQEFDRLERPILIVDNFPDSPVESRRREQSIGVGLRDDVRIGAGGEQNAHHLDIRELAATMNASRQARRCSHRSRAVSWWAGRHCRFDRACANSAFTSCSLRDPEFR
jgi:hypothetical protein